MTSDPSFSANVRRAPVPPCRDPFINTNLRSLGPGEDGEERFWISSWNSHSGTIGLMVTESGRERLYRFGWWHPGFYSAAQEDADTLWLCGNLSKVVRLTLSTGEYEAYETGATSALAFDGMTFDPATKKLFATAFPPPHTDAFSFDTVTRKTVKNYRDIGAEKYPRGQFSNGDGTYSLAMIGPGLTMMHWDPANETLERVPLHEQVDGTELPIDLDSHHYRFAGDGNGRWYIPDFGWYDPATRRVSPDGPRPEREMSWFRREGKRMWGLARTDKAVTVVGLWDMETGSVSDICKLTDCNVQSATITQSGKIVAVSLYGDFIRHDARTGALEISKRLPTDSIGHIDCLRRIDKDRVLGTPFITQRFWETNLATGQGYDCGRAAPGVGEILLTWKLGEKIYMAAYTSGELVEYDPKVHPHFPENPRVVAAPPHAMRPVAEATDGLVIYYSCNHEYGLLGCALTRYDTAGGTSLYRDDPIPGQAIASMVYDGATDTLLAATTFEADCQSATPSSSHCYLARIAANDLTVLELVQAPEGAQRVRIIGALEGSRYLCQVTLGGAAAGSYWFALSTAEFRVPAIANMAPFPDGLSVVKATDMPGLFVVLSRQSDLQLWDWEAGRGIRTLYPATDGVSNFFVDGDSVLVPWQDEVLVLEGCLAAV